MGKSEQVLPLWTYFYFFHQKLSAKVIEWGVLEIKQHKYKLVLEWVTIWWVALFIQRWKASYNQDVNLEPKAWLGS